MKTADLIDEHSAQLEFVQLQFRKFGKKAFIGGMIETVKCFEENTKMRELLQSPGEGRILVVDGGGSMRTAILGDKMAGWAIDSGWAGLIINGAIRDSVEVNEMDIAVFALGTSPVRSEKTNAGQSGIEVKFGGVRFESGHYVYADADGVLYSPANLV